MIKLCTIDYVHETNSQTKIGTNRHQGASGQIREI